MSVEVGTAWKARSAELAEWAFKNLANRFDGWGQYTRGENAKSFTAKGELKRGLLEQHFAGAITIGLHNVAPDQLTRWCVWDFDLHEAFDEAKAQENLNQALLVERTLAGLGATSLIHDSNGKGGFHVWLFFDKPRFCWDVYAWGREFGKNLELLQHEFYPKQARINEWGNFVRLFGRHHKRDHWSRFLAHPDTWLEGDEAIDWLLGIPQADVDALIPETASPVVTPPLPAAARSAGPRPAGLANIDRTLHADAGDDILKAVAVLRKLHTRRVDDYDEWVKVGMALHAIDPGAETLALWDGWSRKSPKYTLGDCAAKWQTFRDTTVCSVGLGTLIQWARDDEAPATTPDDRKRLLKDLNERLSEKNRSICITRILQHGTTDPTFTFEFDGAKPALVGGMDVLTSFVKTRNVIGGATKIILSTELKKSWDSIAQSVLDLAEIVDIGSEEDETRAWLTSAMRHAAPLNCTTFEMLDKAQHDISRIGFIYEGVTYIRAEIFAKHLKLNMLGNVANKEVSRRLSLIGYRRIRFVRRKGAIRIDMNVWANEDQLPYEQGETPF